MPGEKRKRAYGVSCIACRQKKIACDGARPRCGGCTDTQEECKVPTSARPLRRLQAMSGPLEPPSGAEATIAQLTERLRRMEQRMAQVEDVLDLPSGHDWSPSDTPPLYTGASASMGANSSVEREVVTSRRSAASEDDGAKYRLTIDDTGNVVYHGLTSWSQGPNVTTQLPAPIPAVLSDGMTDPAFAPIFQALATSKHISVAPELGDALLDAYFCYQVFNIIQRSTFLRDMALGGPMFSEFLLMSMYASATRMIDGLDVEQRRTQGELFEKLAKGYLAREMDGPAKITTIQGLLLLSGRECALGNISQGWNHAGLAFRMIQDLGIHLAPEKLAGASSLSFEEQATRDRLFWTAFIWDKSISLALGREPTFPPRLGRDPGTMTDFDDDEGPWTAYFVSSLNCPPSLMNYVYQPKRRVAAFRFLARICLILHDLIMELYSTESRLKGRQRSGFIAKTRQRLENVWMTVPDTMKFNPSQPSPPPWIFMLQMLYHASSILLFRLIIDPTDIATGAGHVATCLEHSITANQMAVSFTQTFGERMAYVAMYSSFVAASFDILLLEAERVEIQLGALMRLRTWLGIMEDSVNGVPSIRRSVHTVSTSTYNIISKHPVLSMSEAGQWIIALHSQQLPGVSPVPTFDGNGTGVGAFDFFELFGHSGTGMQ